MTVFETALPEGSMLAPFIGAGDFVDCYSAKSGLDVDAVAAKAFRFPRWVGWLMAVRSVIVAPFGLKVRVPAHDRIGFFPVEKRGSDEILLGFDDRHLNFRISVMRRDNMAFAATWVRPHNLAGRTYLRVILPFHRLIVRNAMARIAEL